MRSLFDEATNEIEALNAVFNNLEIRDSLPKILEILNKFSRPSDINRYLGIDSNSKEGGLTARTLQFLHAKGRLIRLSGGYYGLLHWKASKFDSVYDARLDLVISILEKAKRPMTTKEITEEFNSIPNGNLFLMKKNPQETLQCLLRRTRIKSASLITTVAFRGNRPGLVALTIWKDNPPSGVTAKEMQAIHSTSRRNFGEKAIFTVVDALQDLGKPSTSEEIWEYINLIGSLDRIGTNGPRKRWVEDIVGRHIHSGGILVERPRRSLISLPEWRNMAEKQTGERLWLCTNRLKWLPYSAFYSKRECNFIFSSCKCCYGKRVMEQRQSPAYKELRSRLHISENLTRNLSKAISKVLKDGGGNKNRQPWETIVGYTSKELIAHVESLFEENMSWNNYGRAGGCGVTQGWHLDHIRPKASFPPISSIDDPLLREMFALKNLTPIWGGDNLSKSFVWQGKKWTYRDWENC